MQDDSALRFRVAAYKAKMREHDKMVKQYKNLISDFEKRVVSSIEKLDKNAIMLTEMRTSLLEETSKINDSRYKEAKPDGLIENTKWKLGLFENYDKLDIRDDVELPLECESNYDLDSTEERIKSLLNKFQLNRLLH